MREGRIVDWGHSEHGRGRGPTLVAVHGGLLNGQGVFGPVLNAWSERLRLLVPDRRGFARTPGVAFGGIDAQAADLLAFIDRHGPAPAHVLGMSFGGVVALRAMQDRPEAFRSLTLIEAPAVSLCVDDPEVAAWRAQLQEAYGLARAGADAMPAVLERVDPGSAAGVRRRMAAGDPQVTLVAQELLPWRTTLAAEKVRGTGVPVLVASGGRSLPVYRRIGEHVARLLDAAHAVFDGAGHPVHLAGAAFLDVLRRHIAHAEAVGNRSPVAIAEPDPAWAEQFAAERAALARALQGRPVEHFGSTAVRGLAAKPVIDILVGAADQADAERVAEAVETLGYSWWRTDPNSERCYLLRAVDGVRTHHVHVAAHGGRYWRRNIAFRDALRADAAVRADYAALKRRLALRHPSDREAYSQAKTSFVQAVLGGYTGA